MAYRLIQDPAEAQAYLRECLGFPVVAVDTETTGLRKWHDTIVGLCICVAPGEGTYIPMAHDSGGNVPLSDLAAPMRELLSRPKTLRMHNAPFDVPLLARAFGLPVLTVAQAVLEDSMQASLCIGDRAGAGSDSSAGLKEQAEKYLGVKRPHYVDLFPEGTKSANRKFNTLDVDMAWVYGAADADDTFNLMPVLQAHLDYHGTRQTFELEMAYLPELLWLESRGVALDTELAERKVEEANAFASAVEAKVKEVLQTRLGRELGNVNLNSDAQLGRILFAPSTGLTAEEALVIWPKTPPKKPVKNPKAPEPVLPGLGLPILDKTPKGAPSVGEVTLLKLAQYEPAVAWLLEARGAQKVATTYFTPFPLHANDEEERKVLHPSYAQFGTETGRSSCSEPNLQNVPKGSKFGVAKDGTPMIPGIEPLEMNGRDFIVAREGFYLVDMDWSQVEYRIIGGMSQDPALLQVFRDRTDLHIGTASAMFGVSVDEVTKEQRQQGKTINYALNFGAGDGKLAEMLGCTFKEAQEKRAIYNAAFPYVTAMKTQIEDFAQKNRWVATVFGRKRWFEFNSPNADAARKAYFAAMREAVNMPVQGTAADLMKIVTVRLGPWLRQAFPAVRTVATTHDSITFEVPNEIPVEHFAETLRPVVELPWDFLPGYPEITADFEHGQRWGSLKKVGAKDEDAAPAAPPEPVGRRISIWIGKDSRTRTADEVTAALQQMGQILSTMPAGLNTVEVWLDALPGEVSYLYGSSFTADDGVLLSHLFEELTVRDLGLLTAEAVAA